METSTATPTPTSESQRIRAEILRFLREDRLEPKLNELDKKRASGKVSPEHYQAEKEGLYTEHELSAWIEKAAHDVARLQQATHIIKFTHPQTKGASSIFSSGNTGASIHEVGSHTLPEDEFCIDLAIDDAKYLPIYRLLSISIDGCSLLDRAIADDVEFAQALADDVTIGARWAKAFGSLPHPKGALSSHAQAKQIYWPLPEGSSTRYHLLAPLFSSPLAHASYARISADRFSKAAKAARNAHRNGAAHDHGYRDYPGLVIQSFGGSKPQNVSQLNSERRGENYLLPSTPPIWRSEAIRPPLHADTIFRLRHHFGRRREAARLADVLRDFLCNVADVRSNARIRNTRRQLVADLCDQVLQMAAELRELEPGWSAVADCHLNRAEQCWLDPGRSLMDEHFAAAYRRGEWKDEICLRFANWLNLRLQTDRTVFGGPEALAWKSMLEEELKALREELGDD